MGFFDQHILAVLKDGKPRSFTAILDEVGFSHNTLHRHLRRLAAQALSLKRKLLPEVWEGQNLSIAFRSKPKSR